MKEDAIMEEAAREAFGRDVEVYQPGPGGAFLYVPVDMPEEERERIFKKFNAMLKSVVAA